MLGVALKNHQTIWIGQLDVLQSSRISVECKCDCCGKYFTKKRVDIHNINNTLCSKECRNKSIKNPNPKKEKITVSCEVCNKEIQIHESKYKSQQYFLCSNDCYKIHRSQTYCGDKVYNYQNILCTCDMCGSTYKSSKWEVEEKYRRFCSQECYWNYRKENYQSEYYKPHLNDSRDETKIERMIREWLENNNVKFKQECGFLKKYFVDFYLPEYKIIIEANGDYWHCNPQIYDIDNNDSSKKRLNEQQNAKQPWVYDKKRKEELESYGYKVYVLWESDIHNDLDTHMKNIFNQESATTTRYALVERQGEDIV